MRDAAIVRRGRGVTLVSVGRRPWDALPCGAPHPDRHPDQPYGCHCGTERWAPSHSAPRAA